MSKAYAVYIATNKRNTVLYTGMTSCIEKRMFEHTSKAVESFTSKYNINKLVYCETFNTPTEAIMAEKKIKGWTRKKKIDLIEKQNPLWKDLLTF